MSFSRFDYDLEDWIHSLQRDTCLEDDNLEKLLQDDEFLGITLETVLNDEFDEIRKDIRQRRAKRKCSKRAAAPRNRNRNYALEEMDYLSDSQFQRMFRLNRRAFYALLDMILPSIEALPSLNHTFHHRSKEISPRTRLAVTLRWLAGGSYLDICFAFGVSIGSFFKDGGVLWGTIEAINNTLEIGFPLNDPAELERISQGFAEYSYNRMHGCVMAIDGWVMRTRCPTRIEVSNQTAYRNRKGMFGLVVLAGCDHKCRFLMFSCKFPGSTNDCLAWQMTKFNVDVISKGLLPAQYYIICDEAVSCTEDVLSPYGGVGLGATKDSFNFHLSVMRQCIERAFGILTRRWGIFWRPLVCKYERWALIGTVCAKLHNFCIDMNVDPDHRFPRMPEDENVGDIALPFMNQYNAENGGTYPENEEETSQRRKGIALYLRRNGYVRPAHSVSYKQ
jgi:DDE superfamily endonuclease